MCRIVECWKLAAVHQLCTAEDKSTEYTLQLMQDVCKVDLDTCLAYMWLGSKKHSKLFNELNTLIEIISTLGRVDN